MENFKKPICTQSLKIISCNKDDIYEIEFLWKKLNLHIQKCSTYFVDEMKEKCFQKRINEICVDGADIRVFVALFDDKKIGYCISRILNNIGEISSIYVDDNFRNIGIGKKLMEYSLDWFKKNNINNAVINVAVGNEQVISFYNKFNFYERHLVLKMK